MEFALIVAENGDCRRNDDSRRFRRLVAGNGDNLSPDGDNGRRCGGGFSCYTSQFSYILFECNKV